MTASDFSSRPSSSRRRTVISSAKLPAATRSATCMAAEIGRLSDQAKASAIKRPTTAVPTASPIMVVREAATAASASVR